MHAAIERLKTTKLYRDPDALLALILAIVFLTVPSVREAYDESEVVVTGLLAIVFGGRYGVRIGSVLAAGRAIAAQVPEQVQSLNVGVGSVPEGTPPPMEFEPILSNPAVVDDPPGTHPADAAHEQHEVTVTNPATGESFTVPGTVAKHLPESEGQA